MEINDIYQLFLQCPRITTDSRNCSQNSIFVALRGDNFDGNAFAAAAAARAMLDAESSPEAEDLRLECI